MKIIDDRTWEASKKAGVSGYACCKSGSCHNRPIHNAKARKGKGAK